MSIITNAKFQLLKTDALRVKQANAFYKTNHYRGRAKKGEWLAITTIEQKWVCINRLTAIEDFYFMRNMCVAQEKREQGLGSQHLKFLNDFVTAAIYTFPFPDLVSWYEKNGFLMIGLEDLPAPLRTYYLSYTRKKLSLGIAVIR
ncbi:MAG: hypothetical protein AAGB12_11440 [Pseudomonadota bacterium]